jgi:hypothetical protein
MRRRPICDWCGGEIEGFWATITPGGYYSSGKELVMDQLTYHTSHDYGTVSEYSCFAHALNILNISGEFPTPDAGMEWKLVPASESHHYENPYTSPVLGTTPLAELDLPLALYRKLTESGVFTVEHAVDMRSRGEARCLSAKQLGRLDATLLERRLIPSGGDAKEAGSC